MLAIGSQTDHDVQANPPRFFPEYTRPGGSDYVYRDLSFWTSGFFPGNLYLLLERRKLYPNLTNIHETRPHTTQLEYVHHQAHSEH